MLQNSDGDPTGILVAVGGNEDKDHDIEVLKNIVDLVSDPRVEVITTASSIPEEVGMTYKRAFKKIGLSHIGLLNIQSREEANDPGYIDRVKNANVVFFSGGDQLRITSTLGGTPILVALKNKYHKEQCAVAGTSAGASAMSQTMIYEGESTEALTKGTALLTGGTGLVKGIVIDSHFIKRGRFSRLMEVVTTNPGIIGIGLGEDTGVIIRHGHILQAIGNGLIVVFDGQNINYSNISDIEIGEAIAVENICVHTLVKKHGYDLWTRRYLKPDMVQDQLEKGQ